MQRKEKFTKFPNEYIQNNIKKTFGISRKFYIIYLLIDKYRTCEDYSWITIRKVLDFYGYKAFKNKPKAFSEILDVLEYMVNNKMIEVFRELDSVEYDTGIEIRIIPENFDSKERFSKVMSSQLDQIMVSETSLNKEALLMAFLYINSYIICRRKNNSDDIFVSDKDNESPEAFWRSITCMANDLSMKKETVCQCVEYLSTPIGDKDSLLIKKEVGKVVSNMGVKNAPNIYVLNKPGYEKEIEWALQKMMEIYGVANPQNFQN